MFNPLADAAVVASSPNKNSGSRPFLYTNNSPETNSYLRFDVQGLSGPVTGATLEMFVTNGTTPFEVHGVADNSWSELGITYLNAPPIGALLNDSGGFSTGTTVSVDVSAYITGDGLYSLALVADGAGQTIFSSREGATPPQLVIETGVAGTATPTNTPGPTSTSTPTNTPGPTSTPTNTPLPTNTPTPSVTPGASMDIIYISPNTAGSVSGIAFDDEDVLAYNVNTASWSLFFDGSDVGLATANVDLFTLLSDGTLLLSVDNPSFSLAGVGTIRDADIVQFTPTSLGSTTAGTYAWYFDGSDVGLTTSGEDVDALHVLSNGHLLISIEGVGRVAGVSRVEDEDLIEFAPTSLGSVTNGSWSLYFDGSDVSLDTNSNENVSGVWVDELTGEVYLTTVGAFSVTGLSGDGADVFICAPGSLGDTTNCTFSLFWDGSASGLTGQSIDALSITN